MKIYVASSWRNAFYESVTAFLELAGHEIMDWRYEGFGWRQVTDKPKYEWSANFYRDTVLKSDIARNGFLKDFKLMKEADCCVLLLPCGRSAHLEAGWFVGQNKPLYIYIPVYEEPELMYKLANSISFTLEELAENLAQPALL